MVLNDCLLKVLVTVRTGTCKESTVKRTLKMAVPLTFCLSFAAFKNITSANLLSEFALSYSPGSRRENEAVLDSGLGRKTVFFAVDAETTQQMGCVWIFHRLWKNDRQ